MAERTGIEQVVTRVVSQVLDNHVPQLRQQLVERVLQELPATGSSSTGFNIADLLRAVSLIHSGSTQREILRALLDGAIQYCERAALFVIKAGTATGWQARGFGDNDTIKDFHLDVTQGLCMSALGERTAQSGNSSQVDSRFIEQFGAPAEPRVLVLPLMLKDKVAALVYADGGSEEGGKLDPAALELLLVTTSAWLEVSSLRKQAPKEGQPETEGRAETPAPVQTSSSFVDPFAGHAPMHAAATAPASAPQHDSAVPAAGQAVPEEVPVVSATATATAEAPGDRLAGLSPEDADTHRKAQRFAKLLVDEIKLYNQAKVAEGRKNKDLYDRLKEDIEKSRATYQKRYGNTAAASGGYFNAEVVRSLAEDDASILGANFQH
ncbi:MAG TPA: hypothetical protein VFA89_15830 [Terriglobales bacterium]|nr:hypothetical protein [Terriglobales bacterium]